MIHCFVRCGNQGGVFTILFLLCFFEKVSYFVSVLSNAPIFEVDNLNGYKLFKNYPYFYASMEALTQFQELVTKHYNILKSFPEFHEANTIYLELHYVHTKLHKLEEERLQVNINMGVDLK